MNLICFSRKFCYISAIKKARCCQDDIASSLMKKSEDFPCKCRIFFLPLHIETSKERI